MDEERYYNTRKRAFHIVLVLSMIGSGLSLFSYLMMGLMLPIMKTMFYSGALPYPEEVTMMMEQMFETPRPYYLCCALLYTMSLTGVILMWNLKKSGFHLYTLAQLLVLLITVLFLGKERMPLGDIMLTLLFITYYYISLRILGKIKPQDNESDEASHNATIIEESADNDHDGQQE